MSNENPPPDSPSGQENRPNWGSAYPTPPTGQNAQGYGYQPYAVQPKHHSATTAMVLGIVSVAGGILCWLPLFVSPFAWFTGSKAVREIDDSRGALGGRGEAMAGKILGIIGTVLLGLAVIGVILLIVLTLSVDNFWDEDY